MSDFVQNVVARGAGLPVSLPLQPPTHGFAPIGFPSIEVGSIDEIGAVERGPDDLAQPARLSDVDAPPAPRPAPQPATTAREPDRVESVLGDAPTRASSAERMSAGDPEPPPEPHAAEIEPSVVRTPELPAVPLPAEVEPLTPEVPVHEEPGGPAADDVDYERRGSLVSVEPSPVAAPPMPPPTERADTAIEPPPVTDASNIPADVAPLSHEPGPVRAGTSVVIKPAPHHFDAAPPTTKEPPSRPMFERELGSTADARREQVPAQRAETRRVDQRVSSSPREEIAYVLQSRTPVRTDSPSPPPAIVVEPSRSTAGAEPRVVSAPVVADSAPVQGAVELSRDEQDTQQPPVPARREERSVSAVPAASARPAAGFPSETQREASSRRVEVRIGSVDVRSPAPQAPAEPVPPAATVGGFDDYLAVRSYRR